MRRSLWCAASRFGCVAASLLAASVPAAAEEAVVVAATAPGMAPGEVIADGATLALPEGASITLLFRSGQMLKLHGPFEGALQPPGTGGAAALAGGLRMQGVDASVVGGSREMAPSARRAMDGQDIRIDLGRSATYCIGGDDLLWLGRPTAGDTAGLRRRGNVRTIAWPRGAPQVEWPDDVMIEDGDQFEVIDGRGNPGARITFRRFAKRPRDETAWLAETVLLGCIEQARTPLRELARSSVAPELYLGTDRGRHPVYRAGEPVRLIVQTNLDGQLYCFAGTSNNDARAIFPAGAPGGAHIPGHRPILLPADTAGAQSDLRARPGGENIQCYFADRDIGGELPAALVDGAAPLPQALAADLDTIFAAVPLTRVAKASLAVGVE